MEKLAYTVKEAAEALSMHEETVRRLCAEGRIRAVKFGKLWRIPCSEVRSILGIEI